MTPLIAIEGLDGSGKQTLVRQLYADAQRVGIRVVTVSFPRYGRSIYADLCQDALYGRLGDVSESVYGHALLFALDRHDAIAEIEQARRQSDLVLADRYISSNAAYGAARLGGSQTDAGGQFPEWTRQLEIDRLGLPLPDRQILLATPVQLAASRAASRAAADQMRALDRFEADQDLQHRVDTAYRELAASSYLSPWTVLEPGQHLSLAGFR